MQLRNVKGLIWALAASGFLNIILLSSIFSWMVKERSPVSYCSWPQTSKGQFLFLKHKQGSFDGSLLDAFFLTPEFKSIESLFKRVNPPVDKQEIANFLLDGDWQMLSSICEDQLLTGDLSEGRRRDILLKYIDKGSSQAAILLVKTDGIFAAKKLNDQQIIKLLALITNKTNDNENFAKALLISPRKSLWKMAATRLYEYAGEKVPENLNYQAARKRFVSNFLSGSPRPVEIEKRQIASPKPKDLKFSIKPIKPESINRIATPLQSDRLYIVQEGDSLWKLSRRFNVEVEVLKSYNKLSSDALVPSSAIRIPTR